MRYLEPIFEGMGPLSVLSSIIILSILYHLCRRFSHISLSTIPGPQSNSFVIGHLGDYYESQAGIIDFKWQEQFGHVVRFKGFFGEDHLLVSDPKALQYILHTGGYRFVKPPYRRVISRLLSGIGLVWAEGIDHKRHRRIMTPAFGAKECRELVPLFSQYAAKVTEKIKKNFLQAGEISTVDVSDWLSRATLDAMGAAAFDYHIDTLENDKNELGKAYTNLCLHAFGQMSAKELYAQAITRCVPKFILKHFTDKIPDIRQKTLTNAAIVATRVAQNMIDTKGIKDSTESRDMMSLLVRANNSEEEKSKMSNEEMVAQMRTLLLAGFETTATSLTWIMYELARHTDVQERLRHEIHQKERDVKERGECQFSASDLKDMPFLTAVVKESLRLNPAAYAIYRQPVKDEVLPLSSPITLLSGKQVTAIPIPKDTNIVVSINGFNRNTSVFGADAHTYDPDRWLKPGRIEESVRVGVYGNSLTFSGGVRSCIGWRFAVLEIHAFLVELIGNFEFSMTPEAQMVRREACMVMTPTIEGHIEKSRCLPLKVKVAKRCT